MTPTPSTADLRMSRPDAATRSCDPAHLSVTLNTNGCHSTVTFDGILDESSAAAVDTQFDQLTSAGFDEVVLDVTRVRRVDESGAVALAQLWARLRNDGVFCRVRGLHPVLADSPIELLLFIRSTGARVLSGLLLPVPCAS